MDEQRFQAKLNELLERIKELPAEQRGPLTDIADKARQRHQRVQATAAELHEALDHLRLSVKYLVFDLEATRRENAYLRRLVEQLNEQREQRRDNQQDDNFLENDD